MVLRALAVVIVVAGASLLGAPPAAAQDDPREVAARVHREGGYAPDVSVFAPDERAEAAEGAGRGPRGETSVDGDRQADSSGPQVEVPFVRELFEWLGRVLSSLSGPLGYALLALGAAVLILVVVFFAASLRFSSARTDATPRGEGSGDAAIDPFLVGTGESADALAAQGRWREAIHALFLDALGRVGGAEGRHRSRTARELVAAIDGGRAGRAELGALLDLTEVVWFGGREADEARFLEARVLAEAVPRARVIDDEGVS